MRGRPIGSEGFTGPGRTDDDQELAARRFEMYLELTRELDPGSYCFEDILPLLPLDGGTQLACGDTRFEHMQNGTCRKPGATQDKCPNIMANGRKCNRALGHNRKCMSGSSMATRRARERDRRADARRAREEASTANNVD